MLVFLLRLKVVLKKIILFIIFIRLFGKYLCFVIELCLKFFILIYVFCCCVCFLIKYVFVNIVLLFYVL